MLKCFLLLLAMLLGIAVVVHFPEYVERYYTNGIFIYLSGALRFLLNPVPFSVGDILYSAFIVWAVYGCCHCVGYVYQRRFRRALRLLFRGLITVQLSILLFYGLWGMNYYRKPGYQVLHLPDTAYTFNDVKHITTLLIDSLNKSRQQLRRQDFGQSNSLMINRAVKAVNKFRSEGYAIKGWAPIVKASLYSGLLNYMGTSGYNNPFTGEAHINTQMPIFDRPVTACHEMAHQLGFAREDEANFVGFAAAIHSQNPLLCYSGYYLATQEFLHYLHRRDVRVWNRLKQNLSAPVQADLKADSIYWQHYEGKLERLTGLFYNAYLQSNNQPNGLRTYNRMIVLTIAWYRKQHLL